jgi:hypothetical protein
MLFSSELTWKLVRCLQLINIRKIYGNAAEMRSSASEEKVPQLGEHEIQSIPHSMCFLDWKYHKN